MLETAASSTGTASGSTTRKFLAPPSSAWTRFRCSPRAGRRTSPRVKSRRTRSPARGDRPGGRPPPPRASCTRLGAARREANLVRQLHDAGHGQGHLLAGLDDVGVTAGDGVGPEPERHHGREVEGADRGEDSQGLPDDVLVDPPRRSVLQAVAHHQGGDPAGHLHVLDRPAHLTPGIVQGLAVVLGDQAGKLLELPLHQLPQPEEVAGPLHGGGSSARRGRRPGPGPPPAPPPPCWTARRGRWGPRWPD